MGQEYLGRKSNIRTKQLKLNLIKKQLWQKYSMYDLLLKTVFPTIFFYLRPLGALQVVACGGGVDPLHPFELFSEFKVWGRNNFFKGRFLLRGSLVVTSKKQFKTFPEPKRNYIENDSHFDSAVSETHTHTHRSCVMAFPVQVYRQKMQT